MESAVCKRYASGMQAAGILLGNMPSMDGALAVNHYVVRGSVEESATPHFQFLRY